MFLIPENVNFQTHKKLFNIGFIILKLKRLENDLIKVCRSRRTYLSHRHTRQCMGTCLWYFQYKDGVGIKTMNEEIVESPSLSLNSDLEKFKDQCGKVYQLHQNTFDLQN